VFRALGPPVDTVTMKTSSLASVLCGLWHVSPSQGLEAQLSPITRVVELLKGLAEQAEKDGKKEEDLYETYVCWAKTVIDTKTATNAAAASRADELSTYISDLDSGRIELTSERADLEKQVKSLFQDLEGMDAQREQEKSDFNQAAKEMNQAITALQKAVDVLGKATAAHKSGTLLQSKVDLSEGFAERTAEAVSLQQAVELGERFLDKSDALFLRRVLTGEVPTADWKKLNRKADFKMAYKARSFKIQDVLAKMLETFKTNLKDANAKEKQSIAQFTELSKAKRSQLTAGQTALSKQDGEKGAKAVSKDDATKELNALNLQMTNDKKFIGQTTTALADKKVEWKDRQALRTGEIAAINEAIGILNSDDARDLLKKSLSSQSFMQTSSTQHLSAAKVLSKAAHLSGDSRLALLAATVSRTTPLATGSHFDKVIAAIDLMVETLKSEETTDMEDKDDCEEDRAEDTRSAIEAARTMDEHTDTINELKARRAEIKAEIKENLDEIAQLGKDMASATTQRADDAAMAAACKKDDQAAASLVQSAKEVLSKFYVANGLVFVQKRMDPIKAGAAPPPPPSTWEDPYGGKKGEAQGIVAILEMIHADINKDIAKATAEEKKSLEAFTTFKTDTEAQIAAITAANVELSTEHSNASDDETDNKGDRLSEKGSLDAALQNIQDASPGCDYITINYDVRLKNRQIEMDGLVKAKAILQGGEFPSFLEGKQEKSVDAFLQRRT